MRSLRWSVGPLVLVAAVLAAAACAQASIGFTVVNAGLDRPRGLAFTPDGTLYATLVGRGPAERARPSQCNGEGCFGDTGSIVRVDGHATTPIATGLLSMLGKPDGFFSIGADSLTALPGGGLATAMTAEFAGDGIPSQIPSVLGMQTGHVLTVAATGGPLTIGPSISALEFAHDTDGEGKVSNPYGVAALGDVLYVSDSAANTLNEVRGGIARTIASFPHAAHGAQSVPDALTAGPDGALYVGEFTGTDNQPKARIWRVVPGQPPRVFARGLTSITGLAVSARGTVYASEFAKGRVVRIEADGDRSIAASGLRFPAGIAISPVSGLVYVANHSILPGRSRPGDRGVKGYRDLHGQIVRLW